MKLFLKRDSGELSSRFIVFDEKGNEKYIVTGKTSTSKQVMYISDKKDNKLSSITLWNFVGRYFSVKCAKRLYALVPYMNEQFGFMICGSTFVFAGDISSGRFSLIDVDKSPVMTQKKYWNNSGDGFELDIFNDDYEIFSLSVAICAAMYILANGNGAVTTC